MLHFTEDALVVCAESFMPSMSKASSIESLGSANFIGDQDPLSASSSSNNRGILDWTVGILQRHAVSFVCLGGAGLSLYSAYMHFDFTDVF